MNDIFGKLAARVSRATGSVWATLLAVTIVIAWFAVGPFFHYSSTWQLFINTMTTVVTFLMVFLIQNTQNRDTRAVHLKLDELIRAVKGARLHLLETEALGDSELEAIHQEYVAIHDKYLKKLEDHRNSSQK
ncbi:MAG: low affinity iron permease family protein [Microgenomates group bacterium]